MSAVTASALTRRHGSHPRTDDEDGNGAPRMHGPSRRAVVAAAILTLAVIGGILAAGLSGVRAFNMSTASMGTTARVGTIVVTRPLEPATAHVGEVIAFHPPGQPEETFVHRIVGVEHNDGSTFFATRGDISGSNDPWLIPAGQTLGREVFTVPALGWLLRLLPWLVAGTLSVLVLCLAFPARIRPGLRVMGLSAVGIVAVWHFRPLTSFEFITSGAGAHGGGQATLVGTGVLPMTLRALHHPMGHATVGPGHVGTVRTSQLDAMHGIPILASVHLTGWWWLVVVVWLLPLVFAFRYRRAVADETPTLLPPTPPAPRGRHRADGTPTWQRAVQVVRPTTWSTSTPEHRPPPTWALSPGR